MTCLFLFSLSQVESDTAQSMKRLVELDSIESKMLQSQNALQVNLHVPLSHSFFPSLLLSPSLLLTLFPFLPSSPSSFLPLPSPSFPFLPLFHLPSPLSPSSPLSPFSTLPSSSPLPPSSPLSPSLPSLPLFKLSLLLPQSLYLSVHLPHTHPLSPLPLLPSPSPQTHIQDGFHHCQKTVHTGLLKMLKSPNRNKYAGNSSRDSTSIPDFLRRKPRTEVIPTRTCHLQKMPHLL